MLQRAQRHAKIDSKVRWIGEETMNQKYAVIFEQAENNWAAYVPDLPGCITTGKTLEETERNIREAIQGHLQTLREFGDPIPKPTSHAKDIENPACGVESGHLADFETGSQTPPSHSRHAIIAP